MKRNVGFAADMVVTIKAVKRNNDASFTLGDLLDIILGKKVYVVHDKSSCEWNKSSKDFVPTSEIVFIPTN